MEATHSAQHILTLHTANTQGSNMHSGNTQHTTNTDTQRNTQREQTCTAHSKYATENKHMHTAHTETHNIQKTQTYRASAYI